MPFQSLLKLNFGVGFFVWQARKKAHEWLEEASLATPVAIEEELNEKPEKPGEEKTQKDNKIESDKTEVDKSKTVEVK